MPLRMSTRKVYRYTNDICKILDFKNPRTVVANHCKPWGVLKQDTPTSSGIQAMAYINEPNLYRLIVKSRKPEAEEFERKVFEEILPSIHKTGSYSLTINTEQQQAIKQAVNQRAFRTGEHYQAIYSKLYEQFKIPRYQDLPSSKFDEAIKFLGGVNSQSKLSDEDWYDLAWLYKVSYRMINEIIDIEPALRSIKSSKATLFWSLGHDNKPALTNAKRIIEGETAHISDKGFSNKWNVVLPLIRHKSKSRIINFEADIAYLD